MKQDTNKALTASNEQQVLALLQVSKIKTAWQIDAAVQGKIKADNAISARFNIPIGVVKAARYYW